MSEVDHRRAPLVEGIRRFVERELTPFSTPGHKQGRGASDDLRHLLGAAALAADIPLGGGIDDSHFSGDTLRAAETLAAAAWGAERAFFLVNGSSAGNHAYLLATLRPGDEVIVARDLHKSLLVALILTGALPVYVAPRLHPTLNVGLGIAAEDVQIALERHPNAKLVTLVSPSYCGVSSDLLAISGIAHRHGIPCYVDEAWGPHLHFHPDLPPSAMQSGVDGAVISTHKTLASLTQAAILLTQGPLVDPARVATAVGMAQTTSPAATILASIDACRSQMARDGRGLLERTIALAMGARARLRAIPGLSVLDRDQLGLAGRGYDLTKLVIDVDGLGITGFAAERLLRDRFGVQPEMSDLVGVVCLITIGDTSRSIDRLVDAFARLAADRPGPWRKPGGARRRSSGVVLSAGAPAMSPRDAFFAPNRVVPLDQATGEIAAELVIPYPPGIPVLAPGDLITAETIEYLLDGAAHGMYISGPADASLSTIRIVAGNAPDDCR